MVHITCKWLAWCSILRPQDITPRSDNILIDVFTTNVIKGVVSHYHTTVTDNEIPPPTSAVEHLCTVDNVWINASQVQGRGRNPEEGKRVSFHTQSTNST